MTTNVEKYCTCGDAKWPKCADPWYMKQFRWGGKTYQPNLTRHAKDVLGEDLDRKTRAEEIAEAIRTAIRGGTYVSAKTAKAAKPKAEPGQTVAALIKLFDTAVLKADVLKRETTKACDRGILAAFAAFKPSKARPSFGDTPMADLTLDDVKAFRASPKVATLANSTWAKYRTVLGQFFEWAAAKAQSHIPVDPFAQASKAERKPLRRGQAASRTRRIYPDEEDRLILEAGRAKGETTAVRLQSLIKAAVETGMRRGELLALQWGHVHLSTRLLEVTAREEGARKSGKSRTLPISQRLFDEFTAMRKTDPAGEPLGRAAYVFGDAFGGKIKTIRKAWHTAVLRAHDHVPTWVATALSPASSAALERADLHFHDLRHEAGCRWLESKEWTLEEIRLMYGHATLAQTAKYLHAAASSSSEAMKRYDAKKAQEAAQATREAAAALQTARASGKQQENRIGGSGSAAGPRLVKGGKVLHRV